jgi:hypothetical protein
VLAGVALKRRVPMGHGGRTRHGIEDDPDFLSTQNEAMERQLASACREDGTMTERVLAWNRASDTWVVRWWGTGG